MHTDLFTFKYRLQNTVKKKKKSHIFRTAEVFSVFRQMMMWGVMSSHAGLTFVGQISHIPGGVLFYSCQFWDKSATSQGECFLLMSYWGHISHIPGGVLFTDVILGTHQPHPRGSPFYWCHIGDTSATSQGECFLLMSYWGHISHIPGGVLFTHVILGTHQPHPRGSPFY